MGDLNPPSGVDSGSPPALERFVAQLLQAPVPESSIDASTARQAAALGVVAQAGVFQWPHSVTPLDGERLRLGGPAAVLPAVDSTNRFLSDWLGHAKPAWQLVTAECQTAGRGRRGRQWLSPLGSAIAVSMAIPLALPPSHAAGFSLVAGLAVLDVLDPEQRAGLGLKWPNDINAGVAKVGGILIEVLPGTGVSTVLLVGIGLNYRDGPRLAGRLDRSVSDLVGLGINLDRTRLLFELRERLRAFTARFENAGFEPFVDAFNAVHVCQGQRCTVHAGAGDHTGTVLGVAPDGALLLDVGGEPQRFDGGEVSLRLDDGSNSA